MGIKNGGKSGLVALGAVGVMGVVGLFSTVYDHVHKNDPPETARGGLTVVNCERAVKTGFKNPATVDFHTLSGSLNRSGAGWKLTGTLDAQNSFGVKSEFSYFCTTDAAGNVLKFASVRTG